jgi:hypothetical protein
MIIRITDCDTCGGWGREQCCVGFIRSDLSEQKQQQGEGVSMREARVCRSCEEEHVQKNIHMKYGK